MTQLGTGPYQTYVIKDASVSGLGLLPGTKFYLWRKDMYVTGQTVAAIVNGFNVLGRLRIIQHPQGPAFELVVPMYDELVPWLRVTPIERGDIVGAVVPSLREGRS